MRETSTFKSSLSASDVVADLKWYPILLEQAKGKDIQSDAFLKSCIKKYELYLYSVWNRCFSGYLSEIQKQGKCKRT